jgi:hypothetical protein
MAMASTTTASTRQERIRMIRPQRCASWRWQSKPSRFKPCLVGRALPAAATSSKPRLVRKAHGARWGRRCPVRALPLRSASICPPPHPGVLSDPARTLKGRGR